VGFTPTSASVGAVGGVVSGGDVTESVLLLGEMLPEPSMAWT